ncbi:MAG: Periplasmic Sensor Signal Transduction Histidine Kinase [Candidatus Gallionella acididurans]|uniref:histidine kinase n=1 Tax=Candidatus Gallionella acididurans TaxID=1796491 RepID=A0A139BPP9_9PROT|nr:MAG: Periplasmic Sensor Signal Transduction Histidine Kinase [Candidatus Gallionella acididurans]
MTGASKRNSLFRHTAITVASALIIFQLIVFGVIAYYIMLPMAKRSVDDLAGFIVLSAKTWVELPPETRQDFELELAQKHNLWLFEASTPLPEYDHYQPYLSLLEQALTRRTGKVTHIEVTHWEKTWLWVDVSYGGKQIRIGFPEDLLGMQLPEALLLVMAATIVLTLITAIILARRVTRPLESMAEAARHIGLGSYPASLPETGAEELAGLARTFNQMSLQVQALLANRTTVLAGISHDLRTPLARMRIALEMLPENVDPKIVTRLTNDIEEMNRLIGEFLTFSRGIEKEATQEIDLQPLLRELSDNAAMEGGVVELRMQGSCIRPVGPWALRRILGNLISNAMRYGDGQPVEIECDCGDSESVIRVLDRGSGIPPAEIENVFRPFYRLESSRSMVTGGSGLGLAIAQQLANTNGWRIVLAPRPGGGTEARLTIPN